MCFGENWFKMRYMDLINALFSLFRKKVGWDWVTYDLPDARLMNTSPWPFTSCRPASQCRGQCVYKCTDINKKELISVTGLKSTLLLSRTRRVCCRIQPHSCCADPVYRIKCAAITCLFLDTVVHVNSYVLNKCNIYIRNRYQTYLWQLMFLYNLR